MKKILFLSILLIFVISGCDTSENFNNSSNARQSDIKNLHTHHNQSDNAIDYNDALVDIASECIALEDTIRAAYDDTNSTVQDILNAISNTLTACNKSINEINELGGWKGDDSLKNGVMEVVKKEISYYSKFRELLPYLEKPNLTDEELASYNSIYAEIEVLDKNLSDANNNLFSIQEQFARNHGFDLEDENSIEEFNNDCDILYNNLKLNSPKIGFVENKIKSVNNNCIAYVYVVGEINNQNEIDFNLKNGYSINTIGDDNWSSFCGFLVINLNTESFMTGTLVRLPNEKDIDYNNSISSFDDMYIAKRNAINYFNKL